MNSICTDFLDQLSNIWPAVNEARDETTAYWHPDEPPLTTAFSEVGRKIMLEFTNLNRELRSSIFALIEEGMASADDELGIAVATGLIEGLIGTAARADVSLEDLLFELGPLSKVHAEAWIDG